MYIDPHVLYSHVHVYTCSLHYSEKIGHRPDFASNQDIYIHVYIIYTYTCVYINTYDRCG